MNTFMEIPQKKKKIKMNPWIVLKCVIFSVPYIMALAFFNVLSEMFTGHKVWTLEGVLQWVLSLL